MKKISATLFLSFLFLNLFSQNNVNVQQMNPPDQANINVQANNTNKNNDDNEQAQQVNDNDTQQQQADTSCPECLKIKELKKLQHQKPEHNDFVPSKVRHHRLMKAYHRFAKKMKKVFARSKKTKTDYSCFNW